MKKLFLVLLIAAAVSCKKDTSTTPTIVKHDLSYNATWTSNAYYVLVLNGDTVASSGGLIIGNHVYFTHTDSTATSLHPISGVNMVAGDVVHLYIRSLGSTGKPISGTISGSILNDYTTVVSQTGTGTLDIPYTCQ